MNKNSNRYWQQIKSEQNLDKSEVELVESMLIEEEIEEEKMEILTHIHIILSRGGRLI